ncbi:polysaccharide pyruvyl transferase family protein [Salinimicrobium sp. HB62]|uniref:polysaccharide pyruvyl transferase family protein n=1 Tax=Salinimicrobium sp. HB62 TaxID=3077781 RepID=UPI002D782F1F|nr:polysaccharide pyruvyl transferase family protein [Salinimicrobium sp. HB62]
MAQDQLHKLMENKPLPLFWWSEIRFIFRDKENYGDLLSKYLAEKISQRPVKFVHPKKQPWYKWDKSHFVSAGSILHHATKNSIVWGSGIIDRTRKIAPADFHAVRGPQTRNYLLEQGLLCPEVYGDPALLLPIFYKPQVDKKYNLGIIPHYHDYKKAVVDYEENLDITVIDLLTLDVEEVTRQILECENTISSSLHGLIVSHAYGIPSVWVEFSDKLFGDGVKFADYLESVDMKTYEPEFLKGKLSVEDLYKIIFAYPSLPKKEKLEQIKKDLKAACPF